MQSYSSYYGKNIFKNVENMNKEDTMAFDIIQKSVILSLNTTGANKVFSLVGAQNVSNKINNKAIDNDKKNELLFVEDLDYRRVIGIPDQAAIQG